MLVLFVFFVLHVLLRLITVLLSLRCSLETRGEPRNKLHDILHRGLTPVNNHGVLQVVDELLVELRLVLQLKDGIRKMIKSAFKHVKI